MSITLLNNITSESIVHEQDNECCICLESIGKINNCITPCGHHFCFSCLMKSLARNSACPMCRASVIEDKEEDIGSESESEYDDEDEEDDGYEYDNHEHIATCDLIAKRLQDKGYSMADIISIYVRRSRRDDPLKKTDSYIEKIYQDFDHIIQSSDDETREQHDDRMSMMNEDTRRHHRSNFTSILDNTNEEDFFDKLFA